MSLRNDGWHGTGISWIIDGRPLFLCCRTIPIPDAEQTEIDGPEVQMVYAWLDCNDQEVDLRRVELTNGQSATP